MDVSCKWCGAGGNLDEFEHDNVNKGQGFWCPDCDGYTFLNEEKRRFLVVTERGNGETSSVDSPIKLKKQLSPFRYPGGKSKAINTIYSLLCEEKLDHFTEVFAGGASLGLSLLDAGVIKHLHLNDKDRGVAAFWKMCTEYPQFLINRLEDESFLPNKESFFEYRKTLKNTCTEVEELGWAQLVVNRCAFSGITMANPMGDILARWNPDKLISRIKHIHEMSDCITVSNLDFRSVVEEHYWQDKGTLFVDPPYVEKGGQLYPCSFSGKDHRDLAELLQMLYVGFPAADILVTYDEHPLVHEIYPLADFKHTGRCYSIAQKT